MRISLSALGWELTWALEVAREAAQDDEEAVEISAEDLAEVLARTHRKVGGGSQHDNERDLNPIDPLDRYSPWGESRFGFVREEDASRSSRESRRSRFAD